MTQVPYFSNAYKPFDVRLESILSLWNLEVRAAAIFVACARGRSESVPYVKCSLCTVPTLAASRYVHTAYFNAPFLSPQSIILLENTWYPYRHTRNGSCSYFRTFCLRPTSPEIVVSIPTMLGSSRNLLSSSPPRTLAYSFMIQ